MQEEHEDNKIICVSTTDEWTLSQDLCCMCGSLGTDTELQTRLRSRRPANR